MLWFGGVYLGMQLPAYIASNPTVWDLPGKGVSKADAAVGSWGGHAVAAVAYDPDHLTVVTCGQLRKLSWAFVQRYCDEAYGVVSKSWLDQFEMSPSWLTWEQIEAKLNAIRG